MENISYFYNLEDEGNIIKLKWKTKLNSCDNMFNGMEKITEIDISNFDTSNADCSFMFSSTLATSINLGEFNLSSTVMVDRMFINASRLTTVTAAPGTDWTQYNWETPQSPFEGCYNIANWDGDIGLTHANNTKNGGYFGRGEKNWYKYTVFVKV